MAFTASPNVTIKPDWKKIIQTDPRYTGGEAALRSVYDPTNPHVGTAAGSRAETIRQALINYGAVPAGFTDVYGDVDPATAAAATSNPQSILAQLRTAYDQNVLRTRNTMEARGILSSGATNQAVEGEGGKYATNVYNAGVNVGGLLGGALTNYGTAGTNYASDEAKLISDVQSELQKDPTIAGVTAHLVVGSEANYGQPLYAGPDGQLYTADGVPYTPTVFPTPPPLVPSEGDKILSPGPVVT